MSKILVTEDEIHIQRLVKMLLEKSGHVVEVASSGEECLAKLTNESAPDLVILDIMMPGMDGMQVLQTIKASSKLQSIPVVMLTALAQENIVVQGIKLGAIDYIRKPFHPQEFVARIAKHLGAAKSAA